MWRYGLGLLAACGAALAVAVPVSRAGQPQPVIEGRVVRVADGDTITVLRDQVQTRVRLVDIDAPEGGQPWGRPARALLSGLVAGQQVRVEPLELDRYGRTVGRVYLSSGPMNGLYVNREMVRLGGAWVYVARLRDRSKLRVEAEARQARRGLWALPAAERIAPWDWRRQERARQAAARAARAATAPASTASRPAGDQPSAQAKAASSSS